MKIRIATFNIENLFTRFDFTAFTKDGYDAERARSYLPPVVNFLADFDGGNLENFDDFRSLMRAASVSQVDDKRQHTALALQETDAHVVCLQEVDSADALARFLAAYYKKLGGRRDYQQLVLHEANDPRGIDVAALAVKDVGLYTRSHASFTPADYGTKEERSAFVAAWPATKKVIGSRRRIFRRDCLELEVRKQGKTLSVFNCHFKSMSGGRPKSVGIRQAEALAVRRIIEEKFDNPAEANWIIVGDLNDYRHQVKVFADGREEARPLADDKPSGLDPFLHDGFAINLMDRRDPLDQWTHFYANDRTKTQLDYVLASPALAASSADVPQIFRHGMPFRVPNTDDIERYPRVGWDRPKASDHCPVTIELDVD